MPSCKAYSVQTSQMSRCPSIGVYIRQPELVTQNVGGYHRTDPTRNMKATADQRVKGAREETKQHDTPLNT